VGHQRVVRQCIDTWGTNASSGNASTHQAPTRRPAVQQYTQLGAPTGYNLRYSPRFRPSVMGC
ncbi:hypothetical protein JB92DRAFT_2852520, partial [Gautieria morchelliformis]